MLKRVQKEVRELKKKSAQDNLREIKCWYDVYEHHILDKTIRRRHA
jgi:hypothetical protein